MKAIEAAAMAASDAALGRGIRRVDTTDGRVIARAAIRAYLTALAEDDAAVARIKAAIISESCHDETYEEGGETFLSFIGCGSHSADKIARAAIRAMGGE